MVLLSLKVVIKEINVTKTIQFEPSCIVYDACRVIREKYPEAQRGQAQNYNLFLSDKDPRKGVWLESRRSLEYYLLRDGDVLEYKNKLRPLKVRTLDGSVKTVMIDDSNIVDQLMVTICTRLGISNHEEYSLVRDMQEDTASVSTKKDTGTLLKPGSTDKKFETLKKKIRTDDEFNWIIHGQALREQGVEDSEILILRRKYFYSDQNIDSRDPIQLNLLYVQSRDGILKGQYPVNEDDAVKFAALQCQVQLGKHDEKKHKAGYLELKDYLPKEYIKNRGIEKKIFLEHKELSDLKELDAKARYTKNCRELKTYGVAFFLVKEKMKGKNKLVPRLLGITKASVMRLDERSKDILKVWPLTSVKRWAASPKSFTLDFGDYQDGYYSVQTTEGEKIAQLIAGYIDIILKNISAEDNVGDDKDEEMTIIEDTVTAGRGHRVGTHGTSAGTFHSGSVALPAVIRNPSDGSSSFSMGAMQPPTQVTKRTNFNYSGTPMNSSQHALLGNIELGINACRAAMEGFTAQRSPVTPLGSDAASKQWREEKLDESRHQIVASLSAIDGACAAIILKSTEGKLEKSMGSTVSTITSNLTDMVKSMQLVSSLDDVGADGLMKAAKDLSAAISDLLQSVQPGNNGPRKNVLEAAGKVGAASSLILDQIGSDADREFQDKLMSLAKQVASATSNLMMQAKTAASCSGDPGTQQQLAGSATRCALTTTDLITCTKVIGASIGTLTCREQVVDSANVVSQAVDGCLECTQQATNDQNLLDALSQAAAGVRNSLDELISHLRHGPKHSDGKYNDQCEVILSSSDMLCGSLGEAGIMIKHAKLLAQATSDLIGMIKREADEVGDEDLRKKLLAAAKLLAEATGRLVEAAKEAAGNPNDSQQQEKLKSAAERLLAATNAATHDAIRKKLINYLVDSSQQAAICAAQTVTAANAADSSISNRMSQQQLAAHAKVMHEEHIPHLVHAIREVRDHPDAATAHQNLLTAAGDFVTPGQKMFTQSKAVVPVIGDLASATQLAACSKKLSLAIANLKNAAYRAEQISGSSGVEGAIENIEILQRELSDCCNDARDGFLLPLPGQNGKACSQEMGASSKMVGAAMTQLLSAAIQGDENHTGLAALDVASALRVLAASSRGVAAFLPDNDSKIRLIECSGNVMVKSIALLKELEHLLAEPSNSDIRADLSRATKAVSRALSDCIGCLPNQKVIDDALRHVGQSSKRLLSKQLPNSPGNFQMTQSQLSKCAEDLSTAANDIVGACRGDQEELTTSASNYKLKFSNLLDAGLALAGQWKDEGNQNQVVDNLKSISMSSSKLLLAVKALSADPNAPNMKNQLAAAARAVTESINNLMAHCLQSSPGQKACENALRQIEAVRELLENPNDRLNDASYFECVESVRDNSKLLGEAVSGLGQFVRTGELESFDKSVTDTQSAVICLVEATAQAAYIVGVSDPNSEAGTEGIVDQYQFERANQTIKSAFQDISNLEASPAKVLSATTAIAKHTSALCNVCRAASTKTSNLASKRHFVQSAKDIAQATSNMVKTVKETDANFHEANRKRCAEQALLLVDAVDDLNTFVSSPEFASGPAKISDEARLAQRPIIESGQQLLESVKEILKTSKKLSNQSKDQPMYQVLGNQSRGLSEVIKRLVASIRDNAPGQKECDDAIDAINHSIKQLNDASLLAMEQALPSHADNTLHGFQTMVIDTANQIKTCLDPTASIAKSNASLLGRQIVQICSYIDPLTSSTIGAASNLGNYQRQMDVLDFSKTLAESILQLIYVAKESGGNPKAVNMHKEVDDAALECVEAVDDLLNSLHESPKTSFASLADSIDSSCQALSSAAVASSGETFANCQAKVTTLCKAILMTSNDINIAVTSRPEELGDLAKRITENYGSLALNASKAMTFAEFNQTSNQIKKAVEDLAEACKEMVMSCCETQNNPRDIQAKKLLNEAGKNVKEKVAIVMTSLQQGGRGTQACSTAYTQLQGIIGDLDTTLMFATSGALSTEVDGNSFHQHKDVILREAKALTEHAKNIVKSSSGGQEALATSVQDSSKAIVNLSEAVKLGAASLGSSEGDKQALLLHAVRDVTSALADLINATKSAAGKSPSDPAMADLKPSAKIMVGSITSLLNTIKSVEEEASKGVRALEQTISSINMEVENLQPLENGEQQVTPEELIHATKPITSATAKAVAAGKSCRQEDMIACSDMGRKAVLEMLHVARAAAASAIDATRKQSVMDSTRTVAQAYTSLLSNVLAINRQPNNDNFKSLVDTLTKGVANAVSDLVKAAEEMKGSDWVNPNDPNVVAEQELLAAAVSIEAAAKKLAQLRPRKKPKQVSDDLNFEEQILEAAKSIATATTALVKAASAAQKELVVEGKVGTIPSLRHDEGQWSQGLISAAKWVARSTGNLCEAANQAVQGEASEEKLVTSAKQVASSTAQLLVACKVKADPNSENMKRLQSAGTAVTKAAQSLVESAKDASFADDEVEESVVSSGGFVGGMRDEIEAMEKILAKEKELKEAQAKLKKLRVQKYQNPEPSPVKSKNKQGIKWPPSPK